MLRRSFWLAFSLLAACSADLAHDSPYDPNSPSGKQARARVTVAVALEGEADAAGVDVLLQNGTRTYAVATQADGSASLTGVVPGTYTLTVSTRYFTAVSDVVQVTLGSDLQVPVRTLAARRAPVHGSALVQTLTDSGIVQTGGAVVSLVKTGSIRGGAAPAPGLRAAASATAETVASTVADGQGDFAFGEVPAGRYVVSTLVDGHEHRSDEFAVTGDSAVDLPALTLGRLAGDFRIVGTARGVPDGQVTQSRTVTLELRHLNADHVAVGVAAGTAACVPAARSDAPLTLNVQLAAEGTNRVCVSFYDEAGGAVTAPEQSMVWDQTAPNDAALSIVGGATAFQGVQVPLFLQAGDALTPITGMQVSEHPALSGAPEIPYQLSYVYAVTTAGQGAKTLYARFRDRAGNWSAIRSVNVTIDSVAPTVIGSGVLIDADAAFATSRQVVLALSASGATQMRVSNLASLSDAVWEPYRSQLAWFLPAGEGTQTVYAQFRDDAGNTTAVVNDAVTVDTVAPAVAGGGVVVNGGTAYAAANAVTLALSATGAAEVRVSNGVTFTGAVWQAYAPSLAWALAAGDGARAVYVQFRDTAGNLSAVYTDDVVVDTGAPAGTIAYAGSATYASARAVQLALEAFDPLTPVTAMKISESPTLSGAADIAYQTAYVYAVTTAGDGPKSIYAQFRDAAGNTSPVARLALVLDTAAPQVYGGGVLVDGGAAYTASNQVVLALSATGATEMRLGNTATLADGVWEPFRAQTTWFLSPGEGARTVYAQFRDDAGNTTAVFGDGIVVDSVPPSAASLRINGGTVATSSRDVTLTLTASGATKMQISNSPFFDGVPLQDYAATAAWSLSTGDGAKLVAVRFLDAAGNGAVAVASIVLDTQAFGPSLSLSLAGTDVPPVAGRTRNLTVKADFGSLPADAAELQVANDPNFVGAAWQATAPTVYVTLPPGEGVKTVYARVRDAVGNVSDTLAASILVDLTGPAIPGLTLGDVTGDGQAVNGDSVEMQYTVPSDAVSLALERYVPGVDNAFVPLAGITDTTRTTYVDYVTATTGYPHQYRVRALDALGNPSAWSVIVVAHPFTALAGADWVKTDRGFLYQFPVNRGTFSLRPRLNYQDAGGDGVLALPEDLTSWLGALAPGWINPVLVLKTANQDNSLVYESLVPVFSDVAYLVGTSNVGNDSGVGLALDRHGNPTLLYGGEYFSLRTSVLNGSEFTTRQHGGVYNTYDPEIAVDSRGFLHAVFTSGYSDIVYGTNVSGEWVFRTLVSKGTYGLSVAASIAVDADDRVHIVYLDGFYSGNFKHGVVDDWAPEDIDAGFLTAPSLRVDGTGTLHLMYQGPSQTLRYAYKPKGGVWTTSTVDTGADSGELAIDAAGALHTIYRNNLTGVLRYARLSGGVWSFTDLAENAWSISLALDAAGAVHAAWSAGNAMRYATNASGAWVYKTLETSSASYRKPTLRVAPNGDVNVAYVDLGLHSVKYRRLASSAPLPVRPVAGAGNGGRYPALVSAAAGSVKLVFSNGAGVSYADDATGAWNVQTVDPGGLAQRTSSVEIGGVVHLAYREANSKTLRYAERGTDGVWSVPAVITGNVGTIVGGGGGGISLVVQPDGTQRIFFARNGGGYVGIGMAVNGGGGWSDTILWGDYFYPKEFAARRAPDGNVRAFYSGWSSSSKYILRRGVLTGGSWTGETINTANTDQVAYAIDAVGRDHVVVVNPFAGYTTSDRAPGFLRYVTQSGGVWTATNIDVTGSFLDPALALDAQGFVHVVYTDDVNHRLKYANNRTGAWLTVFLDQPGSLYEPAFGLDADGLSYLSFYNAAGNTLGLVQGFRGTTAASRIVRTTAF